MYHPTPSPADARDAPGAGRKIELSFGTVAGPLGQLFRPAAAGRAGRGDDGDDKSNQPPHFFGVNQKMLFPVLPLAEKQEIYADIESSFFGAMRQGFSCSKQLGASAYERLTEGHTSPAGDELCFLILTGNFEKADDTEDC